MKRDLDTEARSVPCAHPRGHPVLETGFDDIPVAAVSVPASVTVRMPIEAEMAAAIDLTTGPRAAGAETQAVLQPELVIREPAGPVPAPPAEGA
jgi:LacI family transcriptional regulator